MSRVELAPEVGDDLDRILDHLFQHQVTDTPSRIEDIIRAIDVLERSPLIGRPAREDLRELVIGRRARGYVALYRYVAELDTVFVLAIRGQKEAGYLPPIPCLDVGAALSQTSFAVTTNRSIERSNMARVLFVQDQDASPDVRAAFEAANSFNVMDSLHIEREGPEIQARGGRAAASREDLHAYVEKLVNLV